MEKYKYEVIIYCSDDHLISVCQDDERVLAAIPCLNYNSCRVNELIFTANALHSVLLFNR